jgi:hypothetical protein
MCKVWPSDPKYIKSFGEAAAELEDKDIPQLRKAITAPRQKSQDRMASETKEYNPPELDNDSL